MESRPFSQNQTLNCKNNDSSHKKNIYAVPLLDEEGMTVFEPYFEQKTICRGELLCGEGSKAEFVAIILDGKICAMKKANFGDKKIVVGVLGQGSIVNGTALLSDQMSSTSLVAAETTKVLILSKKNFEKIAINNPWLGMKIFKFLLYDSHSKLNNAYERIVGFF
jgi:CRP-like cAMP-binding protein